jgi:penicillin-binding protein 1B
MRKLRSAAVAAALAGVGTLIGVAWMLVVLDKQVEARFRGRLFAVPSRVYSAPLVLFPGLDVERVALVERLQRLNYHPAQGAFPRMGEYLLGEGKVEIGQRPFRYAYRQVSGARVVLRVDQDSRIVSLRDARGRELATVEIEPELFAEYHGPSREDRRLVKLDDVPPHLIDAILAIEDRRFYQHHGVNLSRIVGALLANLRAGRVVQGGSTLTQQLVKNFYLSAERTLARKLMEAGMALLLERHHTKDEILEAYLNEVYMGQRGSVAIHGMGEAAHYYFAKNVRDLTHPEAALLAGVIKGPALYSPYSHPERALARRNLVLEVLLKESLIDEAAYEEAIATDLGVRGYLVEDNPAPYFVEFLRQDLARVYGDEILASEGLSVFTTLDPRAQRLANQAVREGLERLERDFPGLRRDEPPLQAALVALVPTTGEIIALVGGRDYALSQFNRATQAHRQPGSVFKPIVALAALARLGDPVPPFTLASRLQDEPLQVSTPSGEWAPANYDGEFRGDVTLRQAIEQSLNVPVARLGLRIGPERIIRTARRMGIESPLEAVPSLALGTFEVTVLEMASAYAVLASGGVVPVLRSYAQVVNEDGRVLERKPLDFVRAFKPTETYLVTSLLQGVVDRGTGRALRRLGYRGDVAGKTGTTSDYRDAWFIGFTPDLLVGVWVGFDDAKGLGIPGSVAALPIFADFLMGLNGADGTSAFLPPPALERIAIHRESGLRAGRDCPGDPEFFLRGTAPTKSCGPQQAGTAFDRMFDWLRERL